MTDGDDTEIPKAEDVVRLLWVKLRGGLKNMLFFKPMTVLFGRIQSYLEVTELSVKNTFMF